MTFAPLDRPVFFDGQRLAAADLTASADATRALHRLHNRALHGWGVVAGFGVTGARSDRSVRVGPGLAIDCTGRELVLAAARDVPVPPVAEPGRWVLVVTGADDDQLAAEERAGVCGAAGAVRLIDDPLVRWLDAERGDHRARRGIDVVLAQADVAKCRLDDDVDAAARQDLAPAPPYVAAGSTQSASWRVWPDAAHAAGVMTTVSTVEAGFGSTPSYQARVAGARVQGANLVDGPVHIENASAASFDCCVAIDIVASGSLANAPKLVSDTLKWQVVWMGVEVP
jgi:hypothetical protein